VTSRSYIGVHIVPTEKVVGSVGRWQHLRSDFFYKSGAITQRFINIGKAMQQGKVLPALDLYKIKMRRQRGTEVREITEYYVVDGHHRVAMARKLGQDFLDAVVVEYQLAGPRTTSAPDQAASADSPAEQAASADPGAHLPGERPRQGEG
jgi:hypothetical protein